MAKGRGSVLNHFLVALIVLFVVQCSLVEEQGATYVVEGRQGWGFHIQKSHWSAGRCFKVGDVLGQPQNGRGKRQHIESFAGCFGCAVWNPVQLRLGPPEE